MQIKITYLKTGSTEVIEVESIMYNSEKIVLIKDNGSFSSYFHGDKVVIETDEAVFNR